MSSCSIARQNRRNRQRQLPPLASSESSRSNVVSNGSNASGSHMGLYENTLSIKSDQTDQETSVNDFENKANNSGANESYIDTTGCSFIKCDVSSRPIGKVFIEDERGFKAIDVNDLFQTFNNGSTHETTSKAESASDLAYKAERCFHNFSFLCHGLLGGMSFLETLFLINLVSTTFEQEETLKHFRFLSQPVHNLYNFLCIICCISVFDRYDIGNLKQFFNYLKRCKLKCIVVILYPMCLLMSFSTANVDEKLCLPDKNITISKSFKFEDTENELFYWKTLSISKCVGAFLAWIFVSLEPNKNLFLHHLKNVLQRGQSNA